MLHHRVCNLCEAMCGLEIEHDGTRVLKVSGDKQDPFSKGFICPKGARIAELHEDPSRLKKPLRKLPDGTWEEIGWSEALAYAGEKLNAVRKTHGLDAVGLYLGNPTVHNYGIMAYTSDLRRALKSKNNFSATSVDQLPHHFIAHQFFGHSLRLPIPDIDRTDYMVIMGANPSASNGSLMSTGGVTPKLDAIRKRGGKVVVIDPRRTETARRADEHLFIRPATDVYFLLALLHEIDRNGWVNTAHLTDHVTGLEELRKLSRDFSPDRVATHCGVAAADIRRIAREYATTERAVLYGRMGLSTQAHGTLCNWLLVAINLVTGHLDRAGGAMFTTPAVDLIKSKKPRNTYGRWRSRVRGLPEAEGELPVAALAEEIMTPGDGQIRAMIIHAGNPVLSSPNGKQLDGAFADLDFMVCIDVFLNETTRHADLILPPAAFLEVDHYDFVFNHLATSNNAKYSPALFSPEPGQWYDWQIAKALVKELAPLSGFKPGRLFGWSTPRRLLNLGLLNSSYGKFSGLGKLFSGLSLAKLQRNPHGIHLGPLKPRLPAALLTKDKQINLVPDWVPEALAPLREALATTDSQVRDPNEFLLVGRRHLRSNNSWMHNAPGLAKGKNRCTVMISEADASRLDLANAQEVTVTSRTGSIHLPAEVTDEMMPGVISIPHGFGHDRKGTKLPVAEANPGVSVNDITDETLLDPITGNAAFSGQVVRLVARV
ncbi:molybdopterin oxidoreductase family protein [Neolewinella antarctica]|uniref:Anaerobic selenocysteine-containing dehydrogenase n=1 Tax=Neolewinella antarctica TaxID=442734 RepID=A0ABX0XFR2_9BACT|nr:molybdopterin oxidoreductase family protein [Neolewinella antarctica]NJC28042.1 anaerobic selenocysteine-containing dehydrogenase [Neolewinella antarctica]